MPGNASSLFIVNLSTGEYMLADYYAVRERGMPDGYEQARDVSTQQWLDALAKASGNERSPLPRALSYEDTIVDLRTGDSTTQDKAQTGYSGVRKGWTDLDCVDTLDFLDALRSLRDLEPCDREYLGVEPAETNDDAPSGPTP